MAFGSCNPSGRWDEVLIHESEDAITDQLPLSRHIPSRTTPVARCPAFFVVCTSFLSVSNLSCRLSFLLSLDNLLHPNLHLMFSRVSVPSGSLALVFALHDLRDFNHLVDELNLQDFSLLLHLLNHGNLCCFTTDISSVLPLCYACATLASACARKRCQLCR